MLQSCKFIKRFLPAVLSVMLFLLSGCGIVETTPGVTNSSEVAKKPTVEEKNYTELNNGLTLFYRDYTTIRDFATALLKKEYPRDELGDIKTGTYYDNMLLLLSVTDIELSVLSEFDMLESISEYDDRAEGELVLSGCYGYRIKQGSGIKFGYDKTDGKLLEGEYSNKTTSLTVSIEEDVDTEMTAITKADIVIEGNDIFALRLTKSVVKNGTETVSTKSVYMLMMRDKLSIGYYEGNDSISAYIPFATLEMYNMNAISFGVGSIMNFEMNIES